MSCYFLDINPPSTWREKMYSPLTELPRFSFADAAQPMVLGEVGCRWEIYIRNLVQLLSDPEMFFCPALKALGLQIKQGCGRAGRQARFNLPGSEFDSDP